MGIQAPMLVTNVRNQSAISNRTLRQTILDPDFKALRVRPGPDVESASVTEERTDLDTYEAAPSWYS